MKSVKTPKTQKISMKKDFAENWMLYLMVLPVVIFYLTFCYMPMYGILIAFKNFQMNADLNFFQNIAASKFVGFKYFNDFFTGLYFSRVIVNTYRTMVDRFIFNIF